MDCLLHTWKLPNQPVHLTPKARAFFTLAISEQNVAFAKPSLLLVQVSSTLGLEARMQDDKQIIEAAKALGITELAPEIYKDMLQPAVREMGNSLATVAKAVNIALSPLEAGVWGYDKIKEWLSIRVTRILSDRKVKNVTEPPLSIAGPLVHNLLFAKDEPELKELYASLLSSAMDSCGAVHPAFVSIIQQLTPDEAMILRYLAQSDQKWPVISDSSGAEGAAIVSVEIHFKEWCERAGVKHLHHYKSYMDNLLRLRLLNFLNANDVEYRFAGHNRYGTYGESILNKEYAHIELTEFGRLFIEACIEQ